MTNAFVDDFLAGKKTAEEQKLEAALQAACTMEEQHKKKHDMLSLSGEFFADEDDAEDSETGGCVTGGGGCGCCGGGCG